MDDKTETGHVETQLSEVASLSETHKKYLFDKHHTLELDPVPDLNDADPYNWPFRKVRGSRVPYSMFDTLLISS